MNNNDLAELLFPNIKEGPSFYEEKYPSRKLKEEAMVTRFAPSPTGFVHLGSLYATFVNRLFATLTDGIFYLRIEDTDHKREVENGINKIKEALDYFKVKVDESPFNEGIYGSYIQSKRKEIYQTYVKDMVRRGLAYPCFCTEEELDDIRKEQESNKVITGYYGKWAKCRDLTIDEIKKRIDNKESYVIRLRTPNAIGEKQECDDLIKGKIYFPVNNIDIVLLKSDGLPTYHLAHVIDDHLMHTTHVIRGDEWLSSMPLHLQLTQLLGFTAPKYVHISPLTKKEGNSIRKLSKRKDPELSISYYQELGIPVEAIKIYFATITNSNFEEWYNQNKESNIEEFKFSFDKMPVGGTLFDIDKLNNICKEYFSMKDKTDLYNEALVYFKEYDKEFYDILSNSKEYTLNILNIEKNSTRVRKDIGCYKDVKNEIWYMFDELFYDNVSYNMSENYDANILNDYALNYINLDSEEEWYSKVKELAIKYGYASEVKSYKQNPDNYKGHVGHICEMIRVALTGRKQTPNLFEIQKVLGIDKIQRRISNFNSILSKK
jgi:glutamyl-tRNA synthetase